MSDKPAKHGFLTVKPRESTEPAMPRVLRQAAAAGVLRMGLPPAEACERYGRWKMRCIRPCGVHGTYLKIDDEFEVSGDVAILLCKQQQAVFCDVKLAEEERVLAEFKKLGLDKRLDIKTMPEFNVSPERESSWRVK